MPNATISVYLSDEEYIKYSKKRKEINTGVRGFVKKELEK